MQYGRFDPMPKRTKPLTDEERKFEEELEEYFNSPEAKEDLREMMEELSKESGIPIRLV